MLGIAPEESLQLALRERGNRTDAWARGHVARRVDGCAGPRRAAERERFGHCDRGELRRSIIVSRPVGREQHGRHASDERGRNARAGGRSGRRGKGLRALGQVGQAARTSAARRPASGRGLPAGREVGHHRRRQRRHHSVGRTQRQRSSPGPSTAPPIRELAVSPDGTLVASAAGEAARVWRTSDGARVMRLPHSLSVDDVAFSSSGAQLLTLARDAAGSSIRATGSAPRSCSTSRGRSSLPSSRRPGISWRPVAATTSR